MRRSVGTSCALLFVAAFAASCAQSPQATPSGAPATSVLRPAPATDEPTTAATSAAGPVPLCAHQLESCDIGPGAYVASSFALGFGFTLADKWTNTRNWTEGGEIANANGAIQWAFNPFKPGTPDAPFTSSAALHDYLVAINGVEVTDITTTKIGVYPAKQFDLQTKEVNLGQWLAIPDDVYRLANGEHVRIFVIEGDGPVVVFMADGFTEAKFATFMPQAQAVLDSLSSEAGGV